MYAIMKGEGGRSVAGLWKKGNFGEVERFELVGVERLVDHLEMMRPVGGEKLGEPKLTAAWRPASSVSSGACPLPPVTGQAAFYLFHACFISPNLHFLFPWTRQCDAARTN